MEAKKLGDFIAARRRELNMTQSNLAEKLHVTDKAVSRWERGVGYPDISTLEPLSDVLGVSLVELMQGGTDDGDSISKTAAEEMLKDTINLSANSKTPLKIGGIALLCVFALAAIGLIITLVTDFKILFLPVGSLLAGLLAWSVPIFSATVRRITSPAAASIISFSFAMVSLFIQFADIARRMNSGDVGGVEDIIGGLTAVLLVFIVVTVSVNIVSVLLSRKRK